MGLSHEPIMELIRASLDPASASAADRGDSPAWRLVTATAHADAANGTAEGLHLLALGGAVSATALTQILAAHRGQSAEEILDSLDLMRAHSPDRIAPVDITRLMRSLLVHGGERQPAELMVELFRRDREMYLGLIVELGDYTATCVGHLADLGVCGEEQTLAQLDAMLRDYVRA
ncbi:hypothetical protein [Streptomyces sp. SBT349]|uniref:hypothetical protein n=1 Tax=Streptomyces sp. SBT349 TaxID=1580539 RepID=UPI00066B7C8D|nr:hypothetical protein [Streptomyces sp. SBT349]